MNAPFKPEIISPILADACVSISNLKKNPAAVVAEAQLRQVAILNRNRPVAYMVSPEVWAFLCDLVDDRKLGRAAREALDEQGDSISVSLDHLLA